jgi:phage/plasmid-associated DNA primase
MTCKGGAFQDIIRLILPKVRQTSDLFNKKDFLLGFENGVVDLRTSKFRGYQYDDYITITTKYNYVPVDYLDLSNNTLKEELNSIIESIQPDVELRTLYLQILASGLDGRPYQKLFLFNGQGGNGKGFTGAMMGRVLGDYYYQAPNGIIKDAEKSNVPSPDMFNCYNKRYINFKEVNGMVKVATLRNLTGGGDFTGRLLNSNPIQFKMNATFVMEFNNAPELDGKPQASDYRRLTHIEFPVNFTDDENKIGNTIDGILYKKANTLYETDDFQCRMKPIFLDFLLSIYKQYYIDGIGIKFDIPQSVRIRTEKFIEDQNLFQKVFYDLYDVVKDETKMIKYLELWSDFQCSEDYCGLKSRRAKQEYGRDELYKWLGKFKVFQTNGDCVKYAVGIVRKCKPLKIIDDFEE